MAAGLGFKTFNTGDVLSAADTNGYLMQGIWVFANAAARDAAVTSPQEGNFAYLKDTNVTTYYTGSAWTNLDTTGMVNPMTTTGDTIYSSSGSTPARLGIGTTGQVLTVAGGVPSWATPSGGGVTSASARVADAQTTTSTSFTDLSTAGPAVTLTTGTKALVIVSCEMYNGTVDKYSTMGYAVSGASTVAAAVNSSINFRQRGSNDQTLQVSRATVVTLTAGSNTFTAKYSSPAGGTAGFEYRDIFVMDLGS
jgi:hypothetical protein